MTAQTVAQRQRDLRARRAMLGLAEVRGIYLPKEAHMELRVMAVELAAKFPQYFRPTVKVRGSK